jgi:hypothetical protein
VKPRRARMVAAFAILMSTIGVCSKASAQVKPASRKPGVMFKGNELPLPPQSGKHWKVPATKLPAPWGTAVQKLLSYGFADPRGCEYREVELTCGTLWWPNKSFLLRTHAWVLPQPVSGKPDAERFAVTWSGLVYPVVTVGEPAGLRADVEAQLKFSQAERIPLFAEPEERLLSHEYPHPLKGCLLLVLGEVDLAEKVWQSPNHILMPVGSKGRRTGMTILIWDSFKTGPQLTLIVSQAHVFVAMMSCRWRAHDSCCR